MISSTKIYVVGVGMTKFEKPGKRPDISYYHVAKEAVLNALDDASIGFNAIEQACVGYVNGESSSGQRAIYEVGLTGIPIMNVNNNCASGSTALYMASKFIQSGENDCVLALGFDIMESGALKVNHGNHHHPLYAHLKLMGNLMGINRSPLAVQMNGNAGIEHMKKYGTTPEHFAKVAYKNHKHSVNNPYAQFQKEYTLEEILESQKIFGPLTKLQCCPPSNGSAAVILASEDFVRTRGLEKQAVEILGIEMATDTKSTFDEKSLIKLVGYDMTKLAAEKLFKKTNYTPTDVDVVELHDCFSTSELITYEALGLCEPGKAASLIDVGDNTYGGKYVINPSGGLISRGHPLGATGIAQCVELCWQLRGVAGKRQVTGSKLALQHNLGLGGAVVVALYKLGFPDEKEFDNLKHLGTKKKILSKL